MLSDVHGNVVALEAVLDDARRQEVDEWWVLGDLVAIGPDPVETLELLTALPAVTFVRGNTDRYVVTGARPWPQTADVERDPTLQELFDDIEASFTWTRRVLDGAGWLEWLGGLTTEHRSVLADGTRVLGVHASPASDDGTGITPTMSDDALRELIADTDADLVVGGHTHQPTDRLVGGIRVVNLGSVSNPITDDLRASYAILDATPAGHRIIHRRVAYDHDEVVRRAVGSGHPVADYIASFQRGQQIRHPSVVPGAPAEA